MSANITINQAAEKAHQVELISLLIELYPNQLQDSEISALSSLMAKLSGDVRVFLQKEIEAQEGNA
ncbi:hypothetical protein [Morganella psychrotolerans]|uniref:Uncharacterized protein n=1 Tax=Morganella psychrotolerans TaxID=368603 RepID=A0A1B8HMU8_9GAMM|nr:hypothetical protein [Morganella psychrotolerans]OBU10775.1 hypothetical protein AYY17_14750 [Morganella psychrotolerans]